MFYGNKDQVRNSLHNLQRKVCCYDGYFSPVPPDFCDCKYGYDSVPQNAKTYYGEQTCCPELRTIVELLDKMTEEEYYNILKRETV